MADRVLLVDTSFAARPIHDWLCEQGFDVWTIGNRPDDLLARRNPERYIQVNYADVEAVQSHVDRLGIHYVVPGCTDVSIETAQRLSNVKTRFDPPETYDKLANKAEFRALCAELDLPAPRRISVDVLPRPGRLIAKPSDSFSGRGISVFDGSDRGAGLTALAAAQAESRTDEALIETYAEGVLHSYSCFLEGARVVDFTIVREQGSVTPYAVDTSHVVYDFPEDGLAKLEAAIERLAGALSLVNGLLHVQFIWDGATPWLIELSRRCPGDLYPTLIELSTGKRHAARYASYFVDAQVPWPNKQQRRHILRHTVTAGHENYEGLWFSSAVPVIEFHPLEPVGRDLLVNRSIDRVALTFLEYQHKEDVATAHDHFRARATYHCRVKGGTSL